MTIPRPNCRHLQAVDLLFSFRAYIQYHIKCCKSYMQTRMRFKADDLQKCEGQQNADAHNRQTDIHRQTHADRQTDRHTDKFAET